MTSPENYSQNGQMNNWQEWKEAKKTQSSVVYVNPDFIENREIFTGTESPILSPESPDEFIQKGPKTPPEPEEPGQTEVFLEEESDEAISPLKIISPVKKENRLIRISVDEEENEKEAGELDEEEEEEIEKKTENEEKSKETKEKMKLEENRRNKRKSTSPGGRKRRHRSRSREKAAKKSRSRSRTRKQKRKRSRSSSRDTFDGISSAPSHQLADNIRCNQCSRSFSSAHDVSVHEIRSHDSRIPCAICAKILLSPSKLAKHIEKYHSNEKVRCRFCDEKFGGKANSLSNGQWNDFREHIFREVLRRKIKDYNSRCSDTVALRGVGRCPHGPPIKCRNFPKCPGSRCIYSHGRCDFSDTCSNSDCPFDHSNRPRVCMTCVKDLKIRRRTRSPPSRSRD